MWWIWADTPYVADKLVGAYSARGAYGQYILIAPQLNMVIAHKCAVPPYSLNVDWNSFKANVNFVLRANKNL